MITKTIYTEKQDAFTKITAKDMLDVNIVMGGDPAEKINMAAHMLRAISQSQKIPVDQLSRIICKAAKVLDILEGEN